MAGKTGLDLSPSPSEPAERRHRNLLKRSHSVGLHQTRANSCSRLRTSSSSERRWMCPSHRWGPQCRKLDLN